MDKSNTTKQIPHGVNPPNYTQTPNILFDNWLPNMSDAELRVTLAIIRKTFGWHKQKDRISLSQLQRLTGMSRQGVINGIEAGLERGTIGREKDGQGFHYFLIVKEVDQPSDRPTSQRSRPVLVNDVDYPSQRSRPVLVNEVDTQNKLSKETYKRKGKEKRLPASPDADASPPLFELESSSSKPEQEIRPPQAFDFFITFCHVMGIDPRQIPERRKGQELKYGKQLADAGWTTEQVRRHLQYLKSDPWWKGKKLGLATVADQIADWHAAGEPALYVSTSNGKDQPHIVNGIDLSAIPQCYRGIAETALKIGLDLPPTLQSYISDDSPTIDGKIINRG